MHLRSTNTPKNDSVSFNIRQQTGKVVLHGEPKEWTRRLAEVQDHWFVYDIQSLDELSCGEVHKALHGVEA